MKKKITVAYGDGIGPEIMKATLEIMKQAGADLEYDEIEVGEKIYKQGFTSGIKPADWEKIVNNRILFKSPITTPQGGGYKSLNVTIRKTLGLFANVRPVKSLHPFVTTKHPNIDTVIIRENEEDLYAGIEHRQTEEVFQCLKLITKPGCEKIIRYAFEYAKNMGRKKITCMTKDNIMKLTDGLFHSTFDAIAKEYPEIECEHSIIDIGTARYADTPQNYDVIVIPNLYGDILSDVAAQIAGSVGLAGSSNIGEHCAMFEAIHGSAPDIAGQDKANPSGLLMGAVLMLNHLGQNEIAAKIENALLKTIEDGMHTGDIYNEDTSKKRLSTQEFKEEVIKRLGQEPSNLPKASISKDSKPIQVNYQPSAHRSVKVLDGVDIFICEEDRNPNHLGERLQAISGDMGFELQMITNRGVKVFPDGNAFTFCTDHWRCRFTPAANESKQYSDFVDLLATLTTNGIEVIKTENLYSFDGDRGYSMGQGQ